MFTSTQPPASNISFYNRLIEQDERGLETIVKRVCRQTPLTMDVGRHWHSLKSLSSRASRDPATLSSNLAFTSASQRREHATSDRDGAKHDLYASRMSSTSAITGAPDLNDEIEEEDEGTESEDDSDLSEESGEAEDDGIEYQEVHDDSVEDRVGTTSEDRNEITDRTGSAVTSPKADTQSSDFSLYSQKMAEARTINVDVLPKLHYTFSRDVGWCGIASAPESPHGADNLDIPKLHLKDFHMTPF